jgi:hypothetical protein
MARDDEFGGGGGRFPARNPRRRRRFWAIGSNSFDRETADGDGNLLSTSEEQGAARDDGLRRRPWRGSSGPWERAREERERSARERGEWEGGIVAWLGTSRRSTRPPSRRWRGASPAHGTQQLPGLNEEDKADFVDTPGFGEFLR